ncbi:nucleotidyltransferase [Rhodococcus fascians]|uniref:hypothetical protein n=1 Tax=Rhodococcoides fascians TaxID=1828 RepID=UPI00050C9A28|nr:hypothetical protein [Rhodococcus fascians]AMY54934.1 hypothetical protein A3L23_03614 [Rhodococcus fascians D188]MBY4208911.1 nucleotidyltransferase [Rhodococcus fascians]
MNLVERQAILRRWVMPSSDYEKDKQDRALRMVKSAIDAWPAFNGVSYHIYAKGSYANNTNVRLDSDVDIAVQNRECLYYEYNGCEQPSSEGTPTYDGDWTPPLWRAEILAALDAKFPGEVSGSGVVAITIDEHDGTRPDIDVVPSFDYVRYDSSDQTRQHRGSKVFPKTGSPIVNYPQQQLDRGTAKNGRTNGRYKRFARALKSAENQLVADGTISDLPSYFMECLVWNVQDEILTGGSDLSAGFKSVLVWLWNGLKEENYVRTDWEEPNGLKYLFHPGAKWTPGDARELVLATWQYLDY